MQPTLENSKYPVFEANQVLTNRHLNQVFNYLDEQERLTRANLIGIGIVCGLEVSLAGTAAAPLVRISKGCGITSQGYLIVEPENVDLVSYRAYTPPPDVKYPLLDDDKPNVPDIWAWEMFPAGEPDTTPFSQMPAGFLDDKVVVLFLELKRESLRNCSPVNCDDRGAEVAVTLRRLLVGKNDEPRITKLMDGTATAGTNISGFETSILAKLNLPDLRLPRYDVPAGLLSSSNAVLAGFLSVFRTSLLATRTSTALTNAYNAFRPLLETIYPSNPFANFNSLYSFLNVAPQNTTQVHFLQYYYDLFDDLLKAYDEFRWKGAELMCNCCPSEALFPRHLVLWLVHPELDAGFAAYRHYFRASSAVSNCESLAEEVVTLFRRLVEMTTRFTNDPPLLYLRMVAGSAVSYIRITPSKLGDVPLSEKCIPYYYLQNGTPKLFQLWNAEKNSRNRAHQNLSYRSYEYDVPNIPDFVSDPLRFDLEPNNFLRIEGHLGVHYRTALTTLLQLREQYRLPIDVIALRTGAFDENMPIDLSQEDCRFRDLETLYDSTREQWLSQLCREMTALYGAESTAVPPTSPNPDRTFFVSKYDFINKYAPEFRVDPHKVGGHYENELSPSGSSSYVYKAHSGQANYDPLFYQLFDAIIALEDALPQDVTKFNYATFAALYTTFQTVAKNLEQGRESDAADLDKIEATSAILTWEEIDDRLEDLLFQCRSDAFKAINDEYIRRVREAKQKQYFSNFLLQHPGIQHKAGVPLGGTFILVYHDDPEIVPPFLDFDGVTDEEVEAQYNAVGFSRDYVEKDASYAAKTAQEPTYTKEVEKALKSIQLNPEVSKDKDVRTLIGALSRRFIDPTSYFDIFLHENANRIIARAVNELTDGTVIADFFLPYLCCADCAGVQYVLPSVQPTFTYNVLCTNPNDEAEVNILPHGGASPYSYKADNGAFLPLSGPVVLSKGTHTLRLLDANNVESEPQTIEIIGKIIVSEPQYKCDEESKKYIASFTVSGGTPPYNPSIGSIDSNNKFTSPPIETGTGKTIVITDSKGCKAEKPVIHTCPKPIDFEATLSCTGTNKLAPVHLKIAGGEGTYQVFFDGKKVNLLFRPELPAGERTITVRDEKGNEKTKKITVPDSLQAKVDTDTYQCSRDLKTYTVKIAVSGGVEPYGVDVPVVTTAGNVLTIGPLPSGEPTVVTVRDAKKCTTKVPLQHQCARKQPSFNISFTRAETDNKMTIVMSPEGGTAPYLYRVNDGKYTPMDKPLTLEPGEYTITIRDSAGIESASQRIVVPPPLQVDPLDYRCENGLYVASAVVSGGSPPYTLLNEGVGHIRSDHVFISNPTPGGQPVGVEIADNGGQVISAQFMYECEPACEKPCAGISRLCSYPLWIQPGMPYDSYKTSAIEFTFTDEKRKTHIIPGLSVEVLPELLNKDFHGTMKMLIVQINEKVARAIGPQRMMLSYDFRDGDPFARLWIEYFDCEMFNVRFSYTYTQGGVLRDYEVRYMKTEKANTAMFTNLQMDAAPLQVPAFDFSVRDQCKGTPYEKVCTEKPPQIAFGKSSSGDQMILTANTSGVGMSSIASFIWYVDNSTEPFYLGSQVVVKVPNLLKTGTTIRLTGITKQGCFVTAIDKINPMMR